MKREPTYSETKSKARKERKNDFPAPPKRPTRIERAIETCPPGNNDNPATHEEYMKYLCNVLVPGLFDIAARIKMESKQPLSSEERKSFSIVWERVSEIVRTRRPRYQDAPVMLIGKLLSDTRSISPAQVHVWTTKLLKPSPIDPPQ